MTRNETAYKAFQINPGMPRMGFSLGVYYRGANGVSVQSHGILFHDVKKPKWKTVEGMEYLSFCHAGEAYTLRGRGLHELYIGLMECTVQSALEFEPSVFGKPATGSPFIDRVLVTDLAEIVRKKREEHGSQEGLFKNRLAHRAGSGNSLRMQSTKASR
jgi:hypothetical protein